MNQVKKLLLVGAAVTFGWSTVQAACMNDKTFCYKADIWGGLVMSTASDEGAEAVNSTFGSSDVKIWGTSGEKDGWTASGVIKLEMASDGDGTSTKFKADEFYAKLDGPVTITAGVVNIGGIEQGNSYVTENGNSYNGGYGDETGDAATLAFGKKMGDLNITLGIMMFPAQGGDDDAAATDDAAAGSTDTSAAEAEAAAAAAGLRRVAGEGNKQVLNPVITWSSDMISFGFEAEMMSWDGDDAPDAVTAWGLGLGVNLGAVTPFLNYGTDGLSEGFTTYMNVGVDWNGDGMGATVALESATPDGGDAINATYLGFQLGLGDGWLTIGYYGDSTEAGGIASEIMFEFGVSI